MRPLTIAEIIGQLRQMPQDAIAVYYGSSCDLSPVFVITIRNIEEEFFSDGEYKRFENVILIE